MPCRPHHADYSLGSVLLPNQRPRINQVGNDSALCKPVAKTFRLLNSQIGQAIIVIGKQARLAMANYEECTH
jgi:hypothetical protein